MYNKTRRSLTANSICFLVWAEPVNYLWNECAETSPVCLKTKKTNKHISTKSLHSDKHGSSFPGVSNIPIERLDNWGVASSHWVTEALLLSMRPGLNGCGHEACSQSHTLWNPPKTIPKKKKKKTLKFAHVQQKLSVNIYYLLMTEVSFLFDVASSRLN